MLFLYIMVFILGLVVGSFLNVCIYRIPESKSIITPPSSCMKCGARLKPFELIPLISYIALKGRCRQCKEPISMRYPLVELLTAAAFTAFFAGYGLTVAFLFFSFLISILIAVFFIDIDHRIIPDGLIITGLAGGAVVFAYNIFQPMVFIYGDDKWFTPLIGLFSGSGVLLVVAVLGMIIYKSDDAMGMGDVKLFAPIGLFLGWKLCFEALFFSIILAGVSSMLLMIIGKKGRKDTIPFGPFIVIGTFITILWGWDIINWYISSM